MAGGPASPPGQACASAAAAPPAARGELGRFPPPLTSSRYFVCGDRSYDRVEILNPETGSDTFTVSYPSATHKDREFNKY